MSYILEALKKAQAERQLGNAPTIHAPTAHIVPVARASRRPVIYVAVATVALFAVSVNAWRQSGPAPAAPSVASVPAPVVSAPPAPAQPAATVPAPAPAPQVALLPAPPDARPATKPEPPTRAAARTNAQVRPAPLPAAAPAPVSATAPAEDTARGFNDLPEQVRREVPKVVFGGYIYSPNPADRLLLVDKMLRREGEEVAPGLVLEKLLPNAAVMNYRGQRYRVPY